MKKSNFYTVILLALSAVFVLAACQQYAPKETATNTNESAPLVSSPEVTANADADADADADTGATDSEAAIIAAKAVAKPATKPATTTTPPTTSVTPKPSTTPTKTKIVAPKPVAVSIQNMAFSPAKISVKAGTTVTWTNSDAVAHTVSNDSGAFESGSLANGKSFSFKFTKVGTFNYHCAPHPWMQGSVVVN